MPLYFHNQDSHHIFIYIIDDTVMCRDVARPSDIFSPYKGFWMAKPGTRMVGQLMIDLIILLPKLRI